MESGDFHRLEEAGVLAKDRDRDIDKFYYSCRDDLFYELQMEHKFGVRKIRRLLYDKFQEFCAQIKQEIQTTRKVKNYLVYIDSSNAQRGGRKFIIEAIQPDRVILINFRADSIETLLRRTQSRLIHPTFPKDEIEQRKIITTIFNLLEYASGKEDISEEEDISGVETIIIDWLV